MVGSPKTSVCNCSSQNNIYIDSLHDQINYLREENKIKTLLFSSYYAIVPRKMLIIIKIKVIAALQYLRRQRMTI